MDRIVLHDLRVRCRIGAEEQERSSPQMLRVQLVLYADLGPACRSDRLEDTVDYGAVAEGVLRLAEGSSFHLLEHLAQRIAASCLEQPRVRKVEVAVAKPRALLAARAAEVRILREKGQDKERGESE